MAQEKGKRLSDTGKGDCFIWIRRNPLKNPDSAKEKQGNPS
jgi:hypothetical protein